MGFTVRELILILDFYFPLDLPAIEAVYFLLVIFALYPLFILHQAQRQGYRQPQETAWKKGIQVLLQSFGQDIDNIIPDPIRITPPEVYIPGLYEGIESIYDIIGASEEATFPTIHTPPPILITQYQRCIICPAARDLRRLTNPRPIQLIGPDNTKVKMWLIVAECPNKQCKAAYYPDHITYKGLTGRKQKLLCDTKYLRISKAGIWVHRKVAFMQEHCIHKLHCGCSNFTEFFNDSYGAKSLSIRQSQQMFAEHFARRLLLASGLEANFSLEADPSREKLMSNVSSLFSKSGDVMILEESLHHGCADCTRPKRYKYDLIQEGAILSESPFKVVEGDVSGLNVSC